MINHFRTLLLNQPGPSPVADGEEYVPASFQPVTLPAGLALVRQAIFGIAPDRRMLLYRTRQLLTCVHAGPLAPFVYQLDERVTYWPWANNKLVLQPSLQVLTPPGAPAAALRGTPQPEDGGKLVRSWRVTLNIGTVTVIADTGQTALLTPPNGVVALPGTNLTLEIPAAATPGTTWTAIVTLRPSIGLPGLVAQLSQAGTALDSLFDVAAPEPYGSWGRIWASHRPLPDRLAAVTCALVYRTNDLLGAA